jgi:hypothetical protein
MYKLLAAFLIFASTLSSLGQTVPPLPKKAAGVKRKADSLSAHAAISVVRVQAEEEFGNFVSSDQEGFTFYDVDRKTDVTLKYVDVLKIKDGYGGYNSVRGRHTDHTKGIVIALVVVGGLAAIIVAAAAAR